MKTLMENDRVRLGVEAAKTLAPPCIWTFWGGLGNKGFFSSRLVLLG